MSELYQYFCKQLEYFIIILLQWYKCIQFLDEEWRTLGYKANMLSVWVDWQRHISINYIFMISSYNLYLLNTLQEYDKFCI
jgi:hypothetical protein